LPPPADITPEPSGDDAALVGVVSIQAELLHGLDIFLAEEVLQGK
jgi:hypothetical protein